jgi:hypothetical protein
MELTIVDKNGWSKTVKLHKAITKIGSANINDIQLDSDLISPVHLQFIYSPETPSSCKLTNLSDEVIIHTGFDDITLPPYQSIDLWDGYEIEAGDYYLIPKLPLTAGLIQTSSKIDATLSIPDPILRPGYPTIGQLLITNKGDQTDCQFDVNLRGLPDDCWEVDPIPLMFPGAQESIRVDLFHQGHYPQAGPREIIFSVTAPEHYPNEELVIKQDVFVTPVYVHMLEVIDDILDNDADSGQLDTESEEKVLIDTPSSPEPISTPTQKRKPRPEPPLPELDARTEEGSQVEVTPEHDLSKLAVIRDRYDEFWEEE